MARFINAGMLLLTFLLGVCADAVWRVGPRRVYAPSVQSAAARPAPEPACKYIHPIYRPAPPSFRKVRPKRDWAEVIEGTKQRNVEFR